MINMYISVVIMYNYLNGVTKFVMVYEQVRVARPCRKIMTTLYR